MARIKSAWEIALEKTADIEIDENKYRQEKFEKEGMTLAGQFINNLQSEVTEVDSKLSSYSKDALAIVREGIKKVVLSNIALPSDDSYQLRFSRIQALAAYLNPEVQDLMSQIEGFLGQYLTAREEFVKRMQDQISQMMKDNPQGANTAQYSELISQNLKKMEGQYSDALNDTISQLEEML